MTTKISIVNVNNYQNVQETVVSAIKKILKKKPIHISKEKNIFRVYVVWSYARTTLLNQ